MKKFLALLLVLLMVISMAACGSKTEEPKTEQPKQEEPKTQQPQNATPEAPKEAPKEAEFYDDIVVGISGKIIDVDVQANSNTQHNYMFRCVYDTPLDFNNQTHELEPNICTEWSTDDAVTWNFTLRDDVYFHNGEHMTANDVYFTFERGKGSNISNSLCVPMTEIKVVDDTHFAITLEAANVDFPYLLTLPPASILCQKAVEADPAKGLEVGSGPWMIDSYEYGDFFKLARFDNFWGEKAKAKTLTYRYMPENSARLIALETGEIDACMGVDYSELSHVTEHDNLELQSYTSSSIAYIAFNCESGVFTDPNLRLAICYGINVEDIIDVVYEGHATKCGSTWGWNEYGYNGGGITQYDYNPDLAKEYLAKAGYSDSKPFKFDLAVSSGTRKATGELIQAQLKLIGVDMTISEYDTAGLSTMTTAGDHEAAIYGCGMNVFGDDITRLIDSNTGVNKSHLHNDRIHELMNQGRQELDDTKRKEIYAEVQQILFDIGAYQPMVTDESFNGVKKGIGGIDYYPTSHHDFSNIYFVKQ